MPANEQVSNLLPTVFLWQELRTSRTRGRVGGGKGGLSRPEHSPNLSAITIAALRTAVAGDIRLPHLPLNFVLTRSLYRCCTDRKTSPVVVVGSPSGSNPSPRGATAACGPYGTTPARPISGGSRLRQSIPNWTKSVARQWSSVAGRCLF